MNSDHLGAFGLVLVLTCTALAAHGSTHLFTDQTTVAGINASTGISSVSPILGGGVVVDFNLDGWQDIYYPSGGNGADKLYLNNADGTFSDVAAAWNINLTHRSSAAAVGDYNNDGLPDIFVTCFGSGADPQMGAHHLFRNTGTGFVDESVAAGVNSCSTIEPDGFGGAWGDIDLDGDLDLAISGFFDEETGNCLMRNNGDGTFTDITTVSGLRPSINGLAGYTPYFIDMDHDRYPELIWIGDFSTSLYYRNDGDGTFTDQTSSSQTSMDFSEMGMTVADWNEDGWFDFYVSTIGTNNLYINQGNHVFVEQAEAAGVMVGGFGWATLSADIDNDSRPDIVTVAEVGRSYTFLNLTQGGVLNFEEVAESIGLDAARDGRGVARFDYDNDGDQDLIFFPSGRPVILMRNDLSGSDTNWLRLFLDKDGVKNLPTAGVGSSVRVYTGNRVLLNRIQANSNYLSQSEASAHFGLGSVGRVDRVVVEWSNGMLTELNNVDANQTLSLKPQYYLRDGFE